MFHCSCVFYFWGGTTWSAFVSPVRLFHLVLCTSLILLGTTWSVLSLLSGCFILSYVTYIYIYTYMCVYMHTHYIHAYKYVYIWYLWGEGPGQFCLFCQAVAFCLMYFFNYFGGTTWSVFVSSVRLFHLSCILLLGGKTWSDSSLLSGCFIVVVYIIFVSVGNDLVSLFTFHRLRFIGLLFIVSFVLFFVWGGT